jgi:hypothetical protein
MLQLVINALVGAGGGFLGDMLKKNGLGTIGNLVAGAAGGSGLPILLSTLGILGTNAVPAAGAVTDAAASGSSTNMIMAAVTSLVGGTAGSLLGGLFKKAA